MRPSGKKAPGSCDLEILFAVPELSLAVGSVKRMLEPASPVRMVISMSSGQFNTGAASSTLDK